VVSVPLAAAACEACSVPRRRLPGAHSTSIHFMSCASLAGRCTRIPSARAAPHGRRLTVRGLLSRGRALPLRNAAVAQPLGFAPPILAALPAIRGPQTYGGGARHPRGAALGWGALCQATFSFWARGRRGGPVPLSKGHTPRCASGLGWVAYRKRADRGRADAKRSSLHGENHQLAEQKYLFGNRQTKAELLVRLVGHQSPNRTPFCSPKVLTSLEGEPCMCYALMSVTCPIQCLTKNQERSHLYVCTLEHPTVN